MYLHHEFVIQMYLHHESVIQMYLHYDAHCLFYAYVTKYLDTITSSHFLYNFTHILWAWLALFVYLSIPLF